ncbi:MAG: SusC/RagA family TonB-linked outer membrane protein [Mediterranea sp.]|jgi:TonB-linked SusC/RagA family outer membrane protein|nr:SusC/RagA family TonB-linked outer membrane protein [Mediterranea sp.]
MKILSTLLGTALLLFSQPLCAQTIRGVVADTKSEPLIGATVCVKNKGTDNCVTTDMNGAYAVKASKGEVLVVSYVGFVSQEIAVGDRPTLNIALKEETQELDDVVVTAMGIKQQKKRLGYTTQQLAGEEMTQTPTMNVGSALSGQISGLTVTNPTGLLQAPEFSLRGRQPLIVLDGVPVDTDFFDIAAENIESVNVLKGVTASALYGSRGKNGAILITSKSAGQNGLEVTVGTSNMVTAGFTVFPKTQTTFGSGSNGKYEFWDGADGGVSDGDMTWGPRLDTGEKIAQWNSPIRDKQTGEVIPWWGDVAGTRYDDKALYERVPIDWRSHDNLNDFLGTGVITDNHFAVAYKAAKARFYISGKYAYQKGQVPNTSLQTGAINVQSSVDLLKNVKLDASLGYNNVFSPNYPRYGYGPKNHMYTILLWMGNDVDGRELRRHLYVPGQEGYRQANYNYAWYNNPYFAAYELEQQKKVDVIDMKARLNWQILPNLNVQGRFAVHKISSYDDMRSPKSYMNYGDSRNGDFKIWDKGQRNIDADVLVSYFTPITTKINLSVNAGASIFNKRWRTEYMSTDGLIIPGLYNMGNSQGPLIGDNEYVEKEIRSLYATAGLDFYNALFLNVTARNDWSSTLPASGNSYFYPSFSVSTLVSEYVKLPRFVDFLKLYGSWAQVSSDLDPYNIYATYNKGVTYGSTPSVSYPGTLVNANIKPEKSKSYELGLSTAILRGRVSLDLTYYHITDENQIINLNVSEASGYDSRKVNGNIYRTNGWEVVMAFKPVVGKRFSWDSSVNWSRSVRKLAEIYGDQGTFNNLKPGDRADAFYGTVWQRNASGELILDPNSALPIHDPYPAKLGHTDPSWRLGFQNRFKIRDFRIDIGIDGAWGGVIRSVTTEKMWWGGKHPLSTEFRDAEYTAGKPVYVPKGVVVTGGEVSRDVNGNIISDTRTYAPNTNAVSWQTWAQVYPYTGRVTDSMDKKFANVFDRSFFKLRSVSVTYDLAKLVDLGRVKSLDLSLFGYNLLMWKKIPYVDPDYGNDDDLQDPSARYIGFSVTMKL